MSEFQPDIHTVLTIGNTRYEFLPHVILPNEVQKFPREQTITYQLRNLADKKLWALKVSNAGYRDRRIVQTTAALYPLRKLPGLSAANRLCLNKAHYPELLAAYPALEYALLMPWIPGRTWAGFMADAGASAQYTREQALALALTTAVSLSGLESRRFAHTDIAGDNVIILNVGRIELIDLEGFYMPDLPAPATPSRGWQGYQHRQLGPRGNYRPDGDRYAGAMLLTEMLTWWNSLVRAATPEEYDALFQAQGQEAAQSQERRMRIVRKTLLDLSPRLASLFDQAWSSPDLAACPELGTWMLRLLELQSWQH